MAQSYSGGGEMYPKRSAEEAEASRAPTTTKPIHFLSFQMKIMLVLFTLTCCLLSVQAGVRGKLAIYLVTLTFLSSWS